MTDPNHVHREKTAPSAESAPTQAPSGNTPAHFDWPLIKRFISFLKPHKKDVILGIAFIPFSVVFSVLYPWLIMKTIDEQLIPGELDGLWFWVIGLLAVLVANYISDAVYNYSLQKAAQKAILDLRTVMFNRVLHFPRHYFDKTPMGQSNFMAFRYPFLVIQ